MEGVGKYGKDLETAEENAEKIKTLMKKMQKTLERILRTK